MTIQRMDHVGIVDDVAAATEFFVELGLEHAALNSSASWSATTTATCSATSAARMEPSSS
jgi:hypothetical protein